MTTLTAAGEEGDGIAPPITVPLDLRPEEEPSGDDRRGRLRRWSIAAAALLHAAVLIWLLWDWRRTPPEPPPPVLAVTLVPPPAPAAAPPKPAAPAPPPKFRESGKDERTTAPATAETEGPPATTPPEAAPAPKPPEPPLPAERPGTLPAPSGAKETRPAVPMLRKPGPHTAAPRKAPARPQIELGEREETGDPYLNRLRDLIERHRVYPPAAVPLGLQGVADYNVLIDRAGHLVGITLTRSSGTPILDEAGVRMIRDASPFPPLPPGYPGQAVMITITLPIFPPGAR